MNDMDLPTPADKARFYQETFGLRLINRLRIIRHRHPNVTPPNFISWEGEPITGADTTAKVDALIHDLTD